MSSIIINWFTFSSEYNSNSTDKNKFKDNAYMGESGIEMNTWA